MGLVIALTKGNETCIAADSMSIIGGSRKVTGDDISNADKIVSWGNSYIGTTDHSLWPALLQHYALKQGCKPKLDSTQAVFGELLTLHQALKDHYFLSEETSSDDDDPFETSGFSSLIVNPHGIFQTYDLRSVQQFTRFAAIGSGSSYAFGALYALYDVLDSVEEIARAVVRIVSELDDSTGGPMTLYRVKPI